MPHLFLLFLLAFSGHTSQGAGQGRLEELRNSTRIDLTVVDPQYDPLNGQINFALRNDAAVPVEYVVLRFEATDPEGRNIWWTFSEPIEGASTRGGGRNRSTLLRPGETLEKSMGTPSKSGVEAVEANVRVQAVIYSDCSFQGDAEAADRVFRDRERLQLVRSIWIERLSRIRSQAGDMALLRKALRQAQFEEVELGGNTVANDRVSSQDSTVRAYSTKVLGKRLEGLLQADDSSLQQGLESFLRGLEDEFEEGKTGVTHDVKGKRVRR